MHAQDKGLARYIDAVKRMPILSKEREQQLMRQWQERGDLKAREALVNAHLRLVVAIASRHANPSTLDELVAEGNVGLLRALDGYEAGHDTRLSTYAIFWIRAQIYGYIVNSSSMVKYVTTSEDRRLFFNLRKLKNKMGVEEGAPLTSEQVTRIAHAIGASEKSVLKMERHRVVTSLNAPIGDDGAGGEVIDLIASNDPDPFDLLAESQGVHMRHRIVEAAKVVLNPRERHIFDERVLAEDGPTLEELSHVYGITRERVRQIEVKARQKVERQLRKSGQVELFDLAA